MRDIAAAAAGLVDGDPTRPRAPVPTTLVTAWNNLLRYARSKTRHTPDADARQVQFHYDVSDDFYALFGSTHGGSIRAPTGAPARPHWPRPRPRSSITFVANFCFDRVSASRRWRRVGRLLLWAAENYGVRATGITLSKNQLAHVQRLIDERAGRTRASSCDQLERCPRTSRSTRSPRSGCSSTSAEPSCRPRLRRPPAAGAQAADEPWHHGRGHAQQRSSAPASARSSSATSFRRRAAALVACWRRWPTPDGRRSTSRTCACTRTHAVGGPDALEARLADARARPPNRMLRAYRLYLAGSAMAFERGWMSLHEYWPRSPRANLEGAMPGAQRPIRSRATTSTDRCSRKQVQGAPAT